MVRARAMHLDSANGDGTPLGLSVNNKWMPELDISYFFNKNVAVELVLTVPQKHTFVFQRPGQGHWHAQASAAHPDGAVPL